MRFLKNFQHYLQTEYAQWIYWIPVGMGVGIALYFSLSFEPDLWVLAALLAIVVILGFVTRFAALAIRFFCWFLITALFGFSCAMWRSHMVDTPQLSTEIGPAMVRGTILSVDREFSQNGSQRLRVTLEVLSIQYLPQEDWPKYIRISFYDDTQQWQSGNAIEVRAVLTPPRGPVSPGSFDFRRHAYFQSIGAYGYAVERPTLLHVLSQDRGQLADSFFNQIHHIRDYVIEKIAIFVDFPQSALVMALLTGQRGQITPDLYTDIRQAGLAHLLAISGLHIGLLTGFIFFTSRWVLAAFPAISLRFSIKSFAAILALLGGAFYTLMVGAPVSAQRSFLMVAFVFLAMILGRLITPMRLLVFAAIAILCISPETLLYPGFQLSFAAVCALITAFSWVSRRKNRDRPIFIRVLRHFWLIALSSLAAGLATLPFSIYHFQHGALAGIFSNFVAIPLTGFWIMPAGLLSYLLLPLGLESVGLQLMAAGVEILLLWTDLVNHYLHMDFLAPRISFTGFIFLIAGGLWFCLWQKKWRYAGIAMMICGVVWLPVYPHPDILIDDEQELIALRLDDGDLIFNQLRQGRFIREQWLQENAQKEPISWQDYEKLSDSVQTSSVQTLRCDPFACRYHKNGWIISLVLDPYILPQECRQADMVITDIFMDEELCEARYFLSRSDVFWHGSHAIRLNHNEIEITSADQEIGTRPWSFFESRRALYNEE